MDGENPFIREHNLYWLENPHLEWPSWKFQMELDDIFTTLPQQFNTMTIPISDRDAFYKDAAGLSYIAKTRAEFLQLLAERRDVRYEETTRAWRRTLATLLGDPAWLDTQVHDGARFWSNTNRVATCQSFDSLVHFFAAFLGPPDPVFPEDNDHLITNPVSNNVASAQLIDAASQPTTPIRTSSSSAASSAHSRRSQNNTTNPTSSNSASAQPTNTASQPTTPMQRIPPPEQGRRRSSRLREKRESNEHRVGHSSSTAQKGATTTGPKRKRVPEESHEVQPIPSPGVSGPGPKRRKMDTTTRTQQTGSSSKRKREPEESHDVQPRPTQGGSKSGPKRRKSDTTTETSHVASASKRKRGPEDSYNFQPIRTQCGSESGPKRRKTDTTTKTPQAALGSKRKRGPDESHEVQPTSTPRARDTRLKRRKPKQSLQSTVSPGLTSTTPNAGDHHQQQSVEAPSIAPQITQAHQQPLPEENARLFQHGQRGEQAVDRAQGTANVVDGNTGLGVLVILARSDAVSDVLELNVTGGAEADGSVCTGYPDRVGCSWRPLLLSSRLQTRTGHGNGDKLLMLVILTGSGAASNAFDFSMRAKVQVPVILTRRSGAAGDDCRLPSLIWPRLSKVRQGAKADL
ncbi:hypothetical protein VPNG_03656 [Cytospora leucostoma]|uniref:Uncharacterized protein n=1 Tax=Cytospora leucostoma TaxID=1230097 RepID=A0A423XCY6_9PEZI|nr:hypothetical protein VPNG_03656 [Cytospora leucostoma]